MKNLGLRRISAFIIDMILISLLTSLCMQIRFINPSYDEYVKINEEYVEVLLDTSLESEDKELTTLGYELTKAGQVYIVVELVLIIGYFIFLQKYTGGQTIGKKIFKLKLVQKDDKEIEFRSLMIRSLIIYSIINLVTTLIAVNMYGAQTYNMITYIVSNIMSILFLVSAVMIVFKENSTGLHDILGKTKVIDLRNDV